MIEIKEINAKELTLDVLDLLTEAFKHDRIELDEAKLRMVERESAGNIHTFIIKLDDKIIGTASLIREVKLFGPNGGEYICHIEDVAIHKDVRGFGYGRILIEHLCKFAKQNNCRKVVLYCSNDNIKFYKKCGFWNACNLMRKDLQ